MALNQSKSSQLTKSSELPEQDGDLSPEVRVLTKAPPVHDESLLKDPVIQKIDAGTETADIATDV